MDAVRRDHLSIKTRISAWCAFMPTGRCPGLQVAHRVAYELPELVERRSTAERAIAFERVRPQRKVTSGRRGVDERDQPRVVDLLRTARDLDRRPAAVGVAAVRQ